MDDLSGFQLSLWQGVDVNRYTICHLLITIINLYSLPGLICLPLKDISEVLQSGKFGLMGVGFASYEEGWDSAPTSAINKVINQGLQPHKAVGTMVSMNWPDDLTMDHIEIIQETVFHDMRDDSGKLITMISDNVVPNNIVQVTIFFMFDDISQMQDNFK